MELTEAEKKKIQKNWIKKEREQQEQRNTLKQNAFDQAKKIAEFIKSKYYKCNVFVFGSLAMKDGWFDKLSDIDIYIDGWEDEADYWDMYAQAEILSRPYNINIVTSRDITESFKKSIMEEGILLQ